MEETDLETGAWLRCDKRARPVWIHLFPLLIDFETVAEFISFKLSLSALSIALQFRMLSGGVAVRYSSDF